MKIFKTFVISTLLLTTAGNLTACKARDPGLCAVGILTSFMLIPVLFAVVACDTTYGAGEAHSRDILSELEAADEGWVQTKGQELASQFALSEEQGMKVARMHRDYALIQNRSDSDLEDFSRRLYGVSPREVEAAIEASQLGHGERFNVLIEEGAAHFGTTPETFKVMVKGLYGSALESAGVTL
jgi:hypothetical protein